MHKSAAITISTLMMASLIMLVPFASTNIYTNPAMAQEYDKYGDNRNSKYPIDDKTYECRTGPFEGFFVSSVEFCDAKPNFDKDDNKVKTFPPPGIITADWWKWVIAIPPEINPLLDETGENCDIDQRGYVWYLAGTTGNLSSAERECTIPEGKQILFPIINTFCSELTDAAYIKNLTGIPPNEPIPTAQLEEGLKTCTKSLIDPVDIREASIDGKDVMNLQNFRVQSPLFFITYPPNNVFGVTNDTGIPQKAIAEGYWVLLDGLKAGEHTIEFTGGVSAFNFTTHVTYHITIEPSNNNDNKYYDNNYGSYNNGYNNNYYY